MEINFTTDFAKCIYPKALTLVIKERGEWGYVSGHYDMTEEDFNKAKGGKYFTIWGKDIPKDIKLANNAKCNDCTAYVFWRKDDGTYVPVRTTASAKTLRNFERQRRKFAHLRPENELCD